MGRKIYYEKNINNNDKYVYFIDGEIIDKVVVDEHSHAEEFDIDLNYGLQMKIILEGWSAEIGDVTFWGE